MVYIYKATVLRGKVSDQLNRCFLNGCKCFMSFTCHMLWGDYKGFMHATLNRVFMSHLLSAGGEDKDRTLHRRPMRQTRDDFLSRSSLRSILLHHSTLVSEFNGHIKQLCSNQRSCNRKYPNEQYTASTVIKLKNDYNILYIGRLTDMLQLTGRLDVHIKYGCIYCIVRFI